jgi:hypothetical protein
MSELANEVWNVAREGGETDDAFLYLSPKENKCAYYSLFCNDMEKVTVQTGFTCSLITF